MAESQSARDSEFVIRSGRPRVRTTFQVLSSLRGEGRVLAEARGMACQWIEAKIARPLPAAIRDGETFSDELHGQRVETVALDGGREWTLRYTRPDEPLPDRPAEPGRTWTTDLWLREETDRVRIAVRDRCTSTNDEQGDAYFVRWPYSDSPRCFLGMHLRNTGNTRDPARCLAIYFFWDPDTLQVVVGWLPSHLPNSRS